MYVATDKATGQKFACKSISKEKLKREQDIDLVRKEVMIMHTLLGVENCVQLKARFPGSQLIPSRRVTLLGGSAVSRPPWRRRGVSAAIGVPLRGKDARRRLNPLTRFLVPATPLPSGHLRRPLVRAPRGSAPAARSGRPPRSTQQTLSAAGPCPPRAGQADLIFPPEG